MLTRLLVIGVVAGAGFGGLLGQASSPQPLDWTTLASGAVGGFPPAAVLAWRLNKSDKDNAKLQEEVNAAHAQVLTLVERMAPVLGEATRTLAEVKAGMEATMDRRSPPAITDALRRLEHVAEEIERDRDRRGPR